MSRTIFEAKHFSRGICVNTPSITTHVNVLQETFGNIDISPTLSLRTCTRGLRLCSNDSVINLTHGTYRVTFEHTLSSGSSVTISVSSLRTTHDAVPTSVAPTLATRFRRFGGTHFG